jgi:sodium transport system permease protein
MIATLLTVLRKEILETIRDRRSLASSLLMGPVLGPLLFVFALGLSLKQSVTALDDAVPVTVSGADHAPHLVQHLRQRGLTLTLRDGSAAEIPAWIEADGELVVLAIPQDLGQRLLDGRVAAVSLYADGSKTKAERRARRVRAEVAGYAGTLAALRLQARGVSPALVQPLVVDDVDLSTPTSRATLVLGMLSYIMLVVTLVGGLSLAIDATAGERERGSLEPLLTAPVPREHLIYGKVLAAAAFMAVALGIVMVTLSASIHRLPLEEIGMSANFDARVAAKLFAVTLPFVAVGASLLTVVASFTRSYKEAQTWLGVVLLVPTLPIAIAGLLDVRASAPLMAIPSLSQHLLIQGLLRDEPLPAAYTAISVASTLAIGLALTWLAGRLYRREKILG